MISIPSFAGDDTGIGSFGSINYPTGVKLENIKLDALSPLLKSLVVTREELAQYPCRSWHGVRFIRTGSQCSSPQNEYIYVPSFAPENLEISNSYDHRYARDTKFGDKVYTFDTYTFAQTFWLKKAQVVQGDRILSTEPYYHAYVKISVTEFPLESAGSKAFFNEQARNSMKAYIKARKLPEKDLVFELSSQGDKITYKLYPGIGDMCVAYIYEPADPKVYKGYNLNCYIGNYLVYLYSENLFDDAVLVDLAKKLAARLSGVERLKLEEEHVTETFLDLKIDRTALPADGKSPAKITGRLRTRDGKGVAGYPVKITGEPQAGKLSASLAKTDAQGNFHFIYTAPQREEVKGFKTSPTVPVTFTITAANPGTGKKADEATISLNLEEMAESLLEVFVHDEENHGVYDKLTLAYVSNGKATTETVFTSEEGRFSKAFPKGVRVKVSRRDDTYLGDGAEVVVPGKVDLLRTTLLDHVKLTRKKVYEFLKKAGFPEEQAKLIFSARVDLASPKAEYDSQSKIISIDGKSISSINGLKQFDRNFAHEIGHFLSDKILDPTDYYLKGYPLQGKWVGGEHNVWVPAMDESGELAFEEAGAHFFAQLFCRYESKDKVVYNAEFNTEKNSVDASGRYVCPGNIIEGNITSFLCDYYKGGMKNPEAVFKDYTDTVQKYQEFYTSIRPARTIEEFMDAKLNAASPGLKYGGDLSKLAEKYRIKAANVWEGVTDSPEALKKIKVKRNGALIDFSPSIELKKGDTIEVPPEVKVAFQKFSDGYFEDGKKEWVSFGPGEHKVSIDKGYDYVQLQFGKAQFVNTSAVSADGEAVVTPSGTSFIIDAGKGGETAVRVVEGAVTVRRPATGEEVKASCGEALTLVPGRPLPKPEASSPQGAPWWKLPPGSAPVRPSQGSAPPPPAEDAEAYYRRALENMDLKDYHAAIENYSKTIELKPSHGKAWYNRGVARDLLGEYAGAASDYTECIRLGRDFAEAWYNRAFDRYRLGDYRASEEDFSAFLALRVDYAPAWYNRGVTREKQGNVKGALDDYRKALELKPDYREAREALTRLGR
ncbi:MAG: tetratricopeptide repeat protein [Candidatus Eremiobacteraeota bacterium]|nr:tetratricopeptide repeat protein [Candidatus Eremiobacteraeota bacterium]